MNALPICTGCEKPYDNGTNGIHGCDPLDRIAVLEADLRQARKTNAELHRRAQKAEGDASRAPGRIHQIRHFEAILSERKQQIESLGYAWSLRGYRGKEERMTEEEVRRLVANVNRIQMRHFNSEYRIRYESLDDQVKQRIEGLETASRNAWAKHSASYRAARRWKRLAKKLRATSALSDPEKKA